MPAGDRPVIVDSTPIIALALADRLDILQAFYWQVVIPEAGRSGLKDRRHQLLVGQGVRRAGEAGRRRRAARRWRS